MSINKFALAGFTLLAGLGVTSSTFAVDVDVNIGGGRTREVVVQPPPSVARRWIPDQVIRKEERVIVEQGHVERREERVIVEQGRVERREERVLVEPEHRERRKQQKLIREAYVEKQWVSGSRDSVRIGPLEVTKKNHDGYWQEVAFPAQYEYVMADVVVPARYETVYKEVQLPPRYETIYKEYPVAPRYEVRAHDVVIPGHWEETVVTPPAVIVEEPRRSGLDLDIDVFRKRKRN